jgi:aminoglycoside phosphotransferase (APT) family kinase protein
MDFDPADTADIRARVDAYLARRFGRAALVSDPQRIGNGLDTYIYSLNVDGEGAPHDWRQPLVLRVYPAVDQHEKAGREYAVQRFAVSGGFPAPLPVAVEEAGAALTLPFMIMQRVPGVPLLERMKNPLRLRGAISAMARLHVRLHRLPVSGCPLPADGSLVDRQLRDVRAQIERFSLGGLEREYRWLEANRGTVIPEEMSVLHNDFHPLNIMVAGDEMSVLDWSDAAVGDRHHDLARTLALFWLAPPLAPSSLERTLLGLLRRYIVPRYLAAYGAGLPVDRTRVRYWQALHAFRAWVQLLALKVDSASLGARQGAAQAVPPRFLESVQDYFHRRTRSRG